MKFACPGCGEPVGFDADEAGQSVGCQKCGNISIAPGDRLSPPMFIGGFLLKKKIRESTHLYEYEAQQHALQRSVILKVLKPELAADPFLVNQFLDSTKIAARLEHPHIVKIFEVGGMDDLIYMAEEVVDGETLENRLQREQKLDPRLAMQLFADLAMAIEYAWTTEKLVHGNIKPAVIEIDSSGVAKLAELGLTQLMLAAAGDNITGTPQYMSPEMILGGELDVRSDIYSLGCVLFHALTGAYPFNGATPSDIFDQHLNEPAPSLKKLNALIPDALEEIVLKMMAKQPEDRFASPARVATGLNALNQGDTRSTLLSRIMPPQQPVKKAAPIPSEPTVEKPARTAKKTGTKTHDRGTRTSMRKTVSADGKKTKTKVSFKGGSRTSISSTQLGMQAAPAVPPKKVPKGLIVAGIMLFLVLSGGGIFYVKFIPNNTAKLIRIYLNQTSSGERNAYLHLRGYLGDASLHQDNLTDLQDASDQLHDFVKQYPASLFTLPAAQVDYQALFGLPDFLLGKHRQYGKYIAGQVTRNMQEYDEFLSRRKRKELHKEEGRRIEAYHQELARQRREEAIRQRKAEEEQRLQDAKQARLDQFLAVKKAVLEKQFEQGKRHEYVAMIDKLSDLSEEKDPMYQDVATWARKKIETIKLAQLANNLVFNSDLKLHGERIQISIKGKRKHIEIRTIKHGHVQIKYRDLLKVKNYQGKVSWENTVVKTELPITAIPASEIEVLMRLSIEKEHVQEEASLLLGAYYFYNGNKKLAKKYLTDATDERADLLRDELNGAD